MPRYYFDLLDGGAVAVDEEGMDLPSLAAAQAEAALALAYAVQDAALEMSQGNPSLLPAIAVRDAKGFVLQLRYIFENDRLN